MPEYLFEKLNWIGICKGGEARTVYLDPCKGKPKRFSALLTGKYELGRILSDDI